MFSILQQKAVRVTTIMKRLRAPEQSDLKATSPAAATPADPAAPQAAADPSAPLSAAAAPEGGPAVVTGLPAGVEKSQPVPEAADGAAAADPQQPSPAQQEAEATLRCNGEPLTSLRPAAEAKDEQG